MNEAQTRLNMIDPEDWEAQDKALDAEIAKDFYAV